MIGKMLSVKELSERLGIGINQTRALVKKKSFPKIKVGKRILIPEEELSKWIARNCF